MYGRQRILSISPRAFSQVKGPSAKMVSIICMSKAWLVRNDVKLKQANLTEPL